MPKSERLSAAFSRREGPGRRRVAVYDCRFQDKEVDSVILETKGLDFNGFLRNIRKEFDIPSKETFVLTATDRSAVDMDRFEKLKDGSTLHLLQQQNQALPAATQEMIMFLPHYDTLVCSGVYEFNASEGQRPLPYAFAELIDNALSATAKNTGMRTIEIRLMFDEAVGKPAVVVLDNGSGMTSKQLNNWAVYRLSKFKRDKGSFCSGPEAYVRPDRVRRSLNSDISYFGIGGKQAAFYIGDSTTMITKTAGSPDVHELVLAKEDFERKEQNNEDIYSGVIMNRQPGDWSHLQCPGDKWAQRGDGGVLRALVEEELGKDSFTAVVVTAVRPGHVVFLKDNFKLWTRELAHLYHYYIHGANGVSTDSSGSGSECPSNIDIQIMLVEKPSKSPRLISLHEVDNDKQSLFIKTAADTFEFAATTAMGGAVEGVVRYHPFLYDKESYPEDPSAELAPIDDVEDDEDPGVQNNASGQRPIFECFWNGRLIPYTKLSEFSWCASPKKTSSVPAECYNRLSGALFADDFFQVSTNKLTFVDLEVQLKDKNTIFTRIINGQEQRVNIQRDFTQWLNSCHERLDKQILFLNFQKIVMRTDVATKKMQHPWHTFSAILWDGEKYKAGDLVKSRKTQPIFIGSIVRFLLYGEHNPKRDGSLFATGGQVTLAMEPRALYDEHKTIPITKIDRSASKANIEKSIDTELAKLPDKLVVSWPEENPWSEGDNCPAGSMLGPLKVEILNKKGESISRVPISNQGSFKKLSVKLTVVCHGSSSVESHTVVAQHCGHKWGYWFKAVDNLNKPGEYVLSLKAVHSESNAEVLGGITLPSYTLPFTITGGPAASFTVGAVSSPVQVGQLFDVPLEFTDAHGNPTLPPADLRPLLQCSGLDVTYEDVHMNGKESTIRGIKAVGKVQNYNCKTHDLKVVLPDFEINSQTVKISLLPGKPHLIYVKTKDGPIKVENGDSVTFKVEVHDEAGNITAHPKLMVTCQIPGMSPVTTDCSTGAGVVVTKQIQLKNINRGQQTVKAKFDVPSMKLSRTTVKELRVVPSGHVSRLEVYCRSSGDDAMMLKDKEKVEWPAGELLQGLFYQLRDEGGREVPLTEELAAHVKVNWRARLSPAILAILAKGELPDLQVPTLVAEERFCQVTYQDPRLSVDVSFTVTPCPSEPKHLKVTATHTVMKMGQRLPGKITLELTDQYGNLTKGLTRSCVKDLGVEAEGLDKTSMNVTWEERSCVAVVTGVQFRLDSPGVRELSFTHRDLVAQVMLRVTAGPPRMLKLTSGPEQPLQVLNEQGIPTPFLIQLCDDWGNASPDQRVVVSLKTSSVALTVKSNVRSQPVDSEGKASFVVESVSAPKGEYLLLFKGSFNQKPLPGPSIKLTVIPDPSKPVRLAVDHDACARLPAGGVFPVFSVTVVSDEGSPVKNINPAAVSMFLFPWRQEATPMPPTTATQLKCSKPMAGQKDDCFHFRDKVIPERAGKHVVQFSLNVDTTQILWSDQCDVTVVANDPVRLGPGYMPVTPVVSNSHVTANRTLVENLPLVLMDLYGNPVQLDVEGHVEVSMKSCSGAPASQLPVFEGGASSLALKLVQGKAHVKRLAISENSPGQDGSQYILHFSPEIGGISTLLAPFHIPFHFFNDAENQKQMFELTKKKDELSAAITVYEKNFDAYNKLLELLTRQRDDAKCKEDRLKAELNKGSLDQSRMTSIHEIDRFVGDMKAEADTIRNKPRRTCTMSDPFRGGQDVLGKVAHLASVEDDGVAAVVSWHIRGDMDCVITKTTDAARRVYSDTHGNQQVMALDSVFYTPHNRPLPHIRNGQCMFRPTGNPMFARHQLQYPEDYEKLFKNLLGDTILMDDLNSANEYRRQVVQSGVQCPTILTRNGHRISSKGKFGGKQNKAPPLHSLGSLVFGAPLPQQYNLLMELLGMLQNLRSAMEKTQIAENELNAHLANRLSPDNVQKEWSYQEKKSQLVAIEQTLASTSSRTKRQLSEGSMLSSTSAKRAKTKT